MKPMKNQIKKMQTRQTFQQAIFDEISSGNLCKIKIINDVYDFPFALIKTEGGLTIIQKGPEGATGIFIPEAQLSEIVNILD